VHEHIERLVRRVDFEVDELEGDGEGDEELEDD
jgi:hypothetical protein